MENKGSPLSRPLEYISIPFPTHHLPFDVPVLPNIEYDFSGFEGFPTRHGFGRDGTVDFEGKSAEDCASLLQSWLFFGLLAEIGGELVNKEAFLTRQRPPKVSIRVAGYWNSPKMFTPRSMESCLRLAAVHSYKTDRLNVAGTHPMPLVTLSINVLISELIEHHKRGWWVEEGARNHDFPRLTPFVPGSDFISPSANLLMSSMMAQGWCQSQMHRICSSYNWSIAHYISHITRREAGSDAHNRCSKKLCQAYNSSQDGYITAHTEQGCRCSFLTAPSDKVVQIIQDGGVPLVSIRKRRYGGLEIEIQAATAPYQYIAISHVWSGGLGNPQANSLPQCQLQRLLERLSSLPGYNDPGIYNKQYDSWYITKRYLDKLGSSRKKQKVPLFWIDTLCIPVDSQYANLRTRAINMMNLIYASARSVLVLDSELQHLSIKNMRHSEAFVRLVYSSWMGRCWTLQEGGIGLVCHVQFADGVIKFEVKNSRYMLEHVSERIYSLRLFFVRSSYTRMKYSELGLGQASGHEMAGRTMNAELELLFKTDVRPGPGFRQTERLNFVTVWNQLIARSTTKAEDLYSIFGNLLDFIIYPLAGLPPEERLKAMLWSSSSVPLSLIYNCGPRWRASEDHCERWVPTEPRGSRLTNTPLLRFSEDNQLLKADGLDASRIIILKSQILPRYCHVILIKEHVTYFVKVLRPINDEMTAAGYDGTCIILEESGVDSDLKIRGACLYVKSLQQSQSAVSTPENRDPLRMSQSNNEEDKPCIRAVFDCPIRAWKIDKLGPPPSSECDEYNRYCEEQECPVIEAESLKGLYNLHLECGKSAMY